MGSVATQTGLQRSTLPSSRCLSTKQPQASLLGDLINTDTAAIKAELQASHHRDAACSKVCFARGFHCTPERASIPGFSCWLPS